VCDCVAHRAGWLQRAFLGIDFCRLGLAAASNFVRAQVESQIWLFLFRPDMVRAQLVGCHYSWRKMRTCHHLKGDEISCCYPLACLLPISIILLRPQVSHLAVCVQACYVPSHRDLLVICLHSQRCLLTFAR